MLAVAGWFSRYAADDYCTAGQVQLAGFLDAQSRLYVGWSGRFAATLLVTLAEVVGPAAVPLLPSIALLVWLSAATWAVFELACAFGWRLGLVPAAALAAVIVYATLQTTADMPQVVFWQTGVLTYLSPLVLATVYVAWLARMRGRSPRAAQWPVGLGVSFGLAFLSGGTSETFAAAQVTTIALAAVMTFLAGARPGRSQLQSMLLAGLVGALLALAIVALAPGNEVRQETTSRAPLTIALPQAVQFTREWLRLTFARPHAVELMLLIGTPMVISATTLRAPSTWIRRPWVALPAGVIAVALVILACMLPAFYALGSNPPGRAQLIPEYVLVCSVALLGWVIGAYASRQRSRAFDSTIVRWSSLGALLLLLGLGPLRQTAQLVGELPTDRAYAASWDDLDSRVRAERSAGVRDVSVPRLSPTGTVRNLDFIGADRHDWFNECVARYYALNTIAADG